jgi:hypothetical protein
MTARPYIRPDRERSQQATDIVCALVQRGPMEWASLGRATGMYRSLHGAFIELRDEGMAMSRPTVDGAVVALTTRGADWWRRTFAEPARAMSPAAQRLVTDMHRLSRDQRRPGDACQIDWTEVADDLDALPELLAQPFDLVSPWLIGDGTGAVTCGGVLYARSALHWYAVAIHGAESPWVTDPAMDWIIEERA